MTDDLIRDRLNERIRRLSHDKLEALDQFLARLELGGSDPLQQGDVLPTHERTQSSLGRPDAKDWPHAPVHRISEHGTYLVTAGTLYKQHHFHGVHRLNLLEGKLLELAKR